MANWGEIFADTFSTSFNKSQDRGFEKWKEERNAPDKLFLEKGKVADAIQKQIEIGAMSPEQGMALFAERYGSPQTGQGGGVGQPQIPSMPTPDINMQYGNIPFVPKDLNMMGVPTGYERDPLAVKQAEGEIGAQSQAQAQKMKMAEQTSRDYFRTQGALDTTFDAALNFSDVQYKKFGLKPGDFLGLADKLTPTQWNEFKDAYEGSSREAAALVARLIIPQSRAIQMVEVFAKSVSKVGSTMEANAQNLAYSMQNGFSNAIANNMVVVDENGQSVNINDTIIDKKTGKPLSQLGTVDKTRAINQIKREFGDNLSTFYLTQAYVKNPKLLKKETIADLKRKAPKFKTIEEVEASDVLPGFPVVVNGKLGVRQ
jgi:hypothetical protein